MSLPLLNRIKKEMSEGIVRAVLEDAGYYVIDTGIEKVVREVSTMPHDNYAKLAFPYALRRLPDFIVMSCDHKTKHLVEVKYRDKWDVRIFDNIKEQVMHMEEITLVFVNASPPALNKRKKIYPSRYIRSCRVRYVDGAVKVELKESHSNKILFTDIKDLPTGDDLWWAMLRLQHQFPQLKDRAGEESLIKAVNAIVGILHESPPATPEHTRVP